MQTSQEIEKAVQVNRAAKRAAKAKHRLANVEVDELSLVDSPAVPEACYVIAKRAAPLANTPVQATELSIDDLYFMQSIERLADSVELLKLQTTLFNVKLSCQLMENRLAAMA